MSSVVLWARSWVN